MHIIFLTNPALGQLNVQLATAQHLVSQGHDVTFLSAESCGPKIDRLRTAQQVSKQDRVRFISLGSGRSLDDFTVRNCISSMRRAPGDPASLEACIEAGLCPAEEYAETAIRVRDHLNALDPDMICVDVLTHSFVAGVRLTKRKFILIIPCSPGLTALPGAFEPNIIASNRKGSWGTFFENLYLNLREYIHSRTHPDRIAKRRISSRRLGLKSYGASRDAAVLPPHWEDNNCIAGIHFNTQGLTDSHRQSPKIVFVGAGVPPAKVADRACPELAWMDEALDLGEDVVYLNMGSMFTWEQDEFQNCIAAFKATYKRREGRVRFLFKINFSIDSCCGFAMDKLPSYIRLTNWIENQQAIYSHAALKVFIHHGGGNSFNEAVYFGVPQLVLSQWLDTHEYASYVEKFGLGLRSGRPPYVDAKDIEAKLLTLLSPLWATYKSNCQSWAVRSQIGGGSESAAKLILFHAKSTVFEDSIPTPPFDPVEVSPTAERDAETLKGILT